MIRKGKRSMGLTKLRNNNFSSKHEIFNKSQITIVLIDYSASNGSNKNQTLAARAGKKAGQAKPSVRVPERRPG